MAGQRPKPMRSAAFLPTQLVIGDLIMTEVLQGFASEADFLGVQTGFRRSRISPDRWP